ncbi:beta-ketoacyl synthase N-terminal-like domain-containing protein [Paenibacillus sp. SAF-068]|uniref:beta-ketoacyl synthase N-terminal-like domain-containing protein n=1 Tax=Paenibacillus sp. SAF-068 TaxID=3436864 RepID=UPI003F800710
MSKSSSRVVIVDYRWDMPAMDDSQAKQLLHSKDKLWENRIEQLSERFSQDFHGASSFDGIFYPSIEERFPLEGIDEEKTSYLLSSERITLSLFQSLINQNVMTTKHDVLVSNGTAQTDLISKSAYLGMQGVDFMKAIELLDPLAYLKMLRLSRPPAIQMVSEASTSGIGTLYSGYKAVKEGKFNAALVGGSCASTMPFPHELSNFGFGSDRFIQPFEQGASGHYFSEGGAAFLIKERQQALADGDHILAEIKDITAGTMGSPVINRNAVKKLVLQSLADAGVLPSDDIFMDLYGRGNEIDDTAEFSCLKNVQKVFPGLKGGYLKQHAQYMIGYYGLIGLCRLLESKKNNTELQGSGVTQPNSYIGKIEPDQWTTQVNDYHWITMPMYSMHGNVYNLVIHMDADEG